MRGARPSKVLFASDARSYEKRRQRIADTEALEEERRASERVSARVVTQLRKQKSKRDVQRKLKKACLRPESVGDQDMEELECESGEDVVSDAEEEEENFDRAKAQESEFEKCDPEVLRKFYRVSKFVSETSERSWVCRKTIKACLDVDIDDTDLLNCMAKSSVLETEFSYGSRRVRARNAIDVYDRAAMVDFFDGGASHVDEAVLLGCYESARVDLDHLLAEERVRICKGPHGARVVRGARPGRAEDKGLVTVWREGEQLDALANAGSTTCPIDRQLRNKKRRRRKADKELVYERVGKRLACNVVLGSVDDLLADDC